jgi:two-component system CheB/CheR fusion protein
MTVSPDETGALDALLEYLKRNRGFDFSGYKRASLERRLHKRMQAVSAETYGDYLSLLEAQPDEITHLFNTVLINVTRFFRDGAPWEYLRSELLPRLVAQKKPTDPIRVWSAGCATGEEAYTLAIVLSEALGPESFRERVKIYATDVDEDALAIARQAVYEEADVAEMPPDLVERYFDRYDGRFLFRKDLRRSVIFGRNDLIQDAPISRVDLLTCRNTLMYFDAPTQAKVLARFHFALCDNGLLMLGRAETLVTYTNAFVPLDLKWRVFSKVPRLGLRDRLIISAQAGASDLAADVANAVRLREAAFETSTAAQIVFDRNGFLILANERARALLTLGPPDLGRPLQDLEVSYRPVELRSAIERAYLDARPVTLPDARWRTGGGEERTVEVRVAPLADNGSGFVGASVTFTDVSTFRRLQQELERSRQDLETTNEELQATNEELETTNEELQSTVEELETTNEELQSTNEELETMNEELQAANEELQSMNDELRLRGDELNQVNTFLEAVFAGLRGAVVVLDRDRRVVVWSYRAEDLWGLRLSEVQGAGFTALDIGLPVGELAGPIHACLDGGNGTAPVVLSAINRRGRPIQCKVTCTPLAGAPGASPQGVIVLMEEV